MPVFVSGSGYFPIIPKLPILADMLLTCCRFGWKRWYHDQFRRRIKLNLPNSNRCTGESFTDAKFLWKFPPKKWGIMDLINKDASEVYDEHCLLTKKAQK